MKNIDNLLCILAVACTLAGNGAQAQDQQSAPSQSQGQAQQQQQPDPAALALIRKLGLSRDMKGPPAYAIPAGVHFSPSVPSNFPVEAYSSNVTATNFLNSTKGAASAGLSISTKDSPAVVFQFYQAALSRGRWNAQIPTAEALAKLGKPGSIYMLKGQREKQKVNITLLAKQNEPGTNISISWYIVP